MRITNFFRPQIIGAVCVGIVAYYYDRRFYHFIPDLFFLLMATAFVIGTFCLLVSCLFSLSTGGIISKTIYVRPFCLANTFLKFSSNCIPWKCFYFLFNSISGIDLSHCGRYFVIDRIRLSARQNK